MLKDLLNKKATLDLADAAGTAVADPGTHRRSLDPRVWLGAAVRRRSTAAERRAMAGPPGLQDSKSYLPRDLALSYLQARQEERTVTGVKFAEGVAHGFDYRWITGFVGELASHLFHRIRFTLPRGAPGTATLAPDARIVLVSDWGTGTGPALAVAEQMRIQIEAAGGREVHVVHLGDVYYAGTRWEAHHRFLAHWPVGPEQAPRVRSWCLNGNHDMYSAGEGLFDVILTDGRFGRQRTEEGRPTSEFHLRNDHWDVVGVDTSWKFDLFDVRGSNGHLRRRGWLAARLGGSPRRRMMLSHHQPFTDQHDGAGVVPVGNLLGVTTGLRAGRGIDAWFWGHEHRLLTYGDVHGIRYATCMGHGAVLDAPAKPAVDGPGEAEFRATFRDSDGDEWRKAGFTVVDLDGPTATVTYRDMDGDIWRAPDVL